LSAIAVARSCSVAIVVGLLAFVVLTALAAAGYSGGTYCEPDADRYRFWGNFFCDLTGERTRRGFDNAHVAALANAGFLGFSLALGPFFWLLGALAAPRRGRWIRVLGITSAVATNAIAWAPSIDWPALHTATVFAATTPALIAAALGVAGLLSANVRLRRIGAIGAITLTAGLGDALGYACAVATHAACLPWLPALQKLAALALLGWMGSVAAAGWNAWR